MVVGDLAVGAVVSNERQTGLAASFAGHRAMPVALSRMVPEPIDGCRYRDVKSRRLVVERRLE